MDIWLPWLVVAISAAIHFIATLVLIAFPSRNITFLQPSSETNGSGGDLDQIRQLDNRARVVFIGLQAASLLSAALAISRLFSTDTDSVLALIVGGAIAFGGRISIQGASSFIAHRYREETRRLTYPAVWVVMRLTSLPGTDRLTTIITGRTPGDEVAGQEASEVLKESLDLLEEQHIPAEESELQMIRGILRMDTVKVREIMRPRPDMIVSSVSAAPEEIMAQMTAGGHSKIPVYADSPDSIVGVVYARDLLASRANGAEQHEDLLQKLARPAIHVPESQNLERLLREFQEHRTSIAIVVDEYGGIAGLVTVTDLIEEIVGELVDEFDTEGPEIREAGDDQLVADGTVSIESVNRRMGTALQGDGYDTIAGLVLKELDRLPVNGDRVTAEGLVITVLSTVGRRVRRVRIERNVVPT